MKYPEYQVWYHVYTSVVATIFTDSASYDTQLAIIKADAIATHAVNKFKEVEDLPPAPNFDVQGLVDKVLKDATSKKK
jgi:hypothetical protein